MSQVAFITGASSGLGRGLALRLARDGYRVALAARRHEALQDAAREIRAAGGEALPLTVDVADRDAVLAGVDACRRELGPVDLLVANAGISIMTRPESLDSLEVERVMRVNFLGAVYAVEAVLPEMLERDRGHLVAVGSLAGYSGLPLTAAYSASKGALHNFFESLRLDLRKSGVDVTMITPGYVKTPLTDRNDHSMPFLLETEDAVDRMVRAIRRRRPLHSFPLPLAALVWLAQILPAGVYDAIASRKGRDKRPADDGF